MTDLDHGAGPLLARVIVNRLWRHHFGRGLVATPSDFGAQGERPSHPELLDNLALQLIENGWRLKPIHKLLMTSAVYQQRAQSGTDRERALYTHFVRRRLEAESLRDAMLFVGGRLDPRMFGPGSLDDKQPRRGIYFTVKRSRLVPWMVAFDCPEPLQGVGLRCSTTVAPQALALMNDAAVIDCARSFGRSLLAMRVESAGGALGTSGDAAAARIERAYRLALARAPDDIEVSLARDFLAEQTARYASSGPAAAAEEKAWTDFCHALLSLNEFAYVD